jgi:hypothetical protein
MPGLRFTILGRVCHHCLSTVTSEYSRTVQQRQDSTATSPLLSVDQRGSSTLSARLNDIQRSQGGDFARKASHSVEN